MSQLDKVTFNNTEPPKSNTPGLDGVSFGPEQIARTDLRDVPVEEGPITKFHEGYIPGYHHPEYYPASNQHLGHLFTRYIGGLATGAASGLLSTAGYLIDVPGWVNNWTASEEEFGNWFSDWAEDWGQRATESKALKVYQTPQSEGFKPWQPRFWSKHAHTIGNSLSLMFPGVGVTKLATGAMKGLNVTSKFGKAAQAGAAYTAGGVTSRYVESLMEANSTYDQMIQNGESAFNAGDAAARTFRGNMSLFMIDAIQYGMLMKGGAKALGKIGASARHKDFKAPLWKQALEQAPLEGAEEAAQFLIAEEAQAVASGEAEDMFIIGRAFGERLGDYMRDMELWESAFIGAAMGGTMPLAKAGVEKAYEVTLGKGKPAEVDRDLAVFKEKGNDIAEKITKDKVFFRHAFQMSMRGDLTKYEEELKELMENEQDPEVKKGLQSRLEDIPAFEELFNRVMAQPDRARGGKWEHLKDADFALKTHQLETEWSLRKEAEALESLKTEYGDLLSNISEEELPSSFHNILRLYYRDIMYRSGALQNFISKGKNDALKKRANRELTNAVANNEELLKKLWPDKTKEEAIKELREEMQDAQEIQELTDEVFPSPTLGSILDVVLSNTKHDALLQNMTGQELLEVKIGEYKADLVDFNSATGQLEQIKRLDKQNEEYLESLRKKLAEYIGEGVVIHKGETEYDVVDNGEGKFFLRKSGDPDIPGGSADPFTTEEFEKFVKNNDDISEARLIQIANKKGPLNRKEKLVLEKRADTIAEIKGRNQETNEGNGFTREEIQEWMINNGYDYKDTTAYRNKLDKKYVNEKRDELTQRILDLTATIGIRQEKIVEIAKSLTRKPDSTKESDEADTRTMRGINKLKSEIQSMEDAIARYSRELASLDEPNRTARQAFVSRAKKYGDAAEIFYTKKINQLAKEHIKLNKQLWELSQVSEDISETLNEIERDFNAGKFNYRSYKTRIGIWEKRLKEREKEMEAIQSRLGDVDLEVSEYNNKIETNKGEVLLKRQREIGDLLHGEEGLLPRLAKALDTKVRLEKRVEKIKKNLLDLFDIPPSKIDDQEYIDKKLKEFEKTADKKQKKVIKEAKRKQFLEEKLKVLKSDIQTLEKEVKELQIEVSEIQEIEFMAYPKEYNKDSKTTDPPIISDEGEIDAAGGPQLKRPARFVFSYLRGKLVDRNNKLTDDVSQRRYFKFVHNNSMKRGKWYIKLAKHSIKGEPTDYAILLEDRLQDNKEITEDLIFAIIVDQDGDPIDFERRKLTDRSIENIKANGIYTTFPTANKDWDYQGKDSEDPKVKKQADKDFKESLEAHERNLETWTGILDTGSHVFLDASKKSMGKVNYTDTKIPAVETLQNPQRSKIQIATTGETTIQGLKYNVRRGLVLLKDTISGNLNQVYPRRLTRRGSEGYSEVETVLSLFRRAFEGTSGSDNPFDLQLPEVGNATVRDILKEYVYYGPEGGYIYENVDINTGIYKGTITLRGLGERTLFDLIEGKDLEEWLNTQYHQVRAPRLGKKEDYVQVIWDRTNGEFTTKKYDAYETYLLDPNLRVLESKLPPAVDDLETFQRIHMNIYFDPSNWEQDNIPGKKDSAPPTQTAPQEGMTLAELLKNPKAMGEYAKEAEEFGNMGGDTKKSISQKEWEKGVGKKRKSKGSLRNPGKYNDTPSGKDRRMGTVQYYQLEDLTEAKKWFKERFPEIEFKVTRDLIKAGSFGRFTKNGEVLMSPYAEIGTIYHEAFHVVMGLYLSKKEKDALFEEYKKLTGRDLSDSEIEEELAEHYREFVLTGKIPNVIQGKPKTFFQRLLKYIKKILGLDTSEIKEIFNNISDGYYARLRPDFSRLQEDKNRSFEDKDSYFTTAAIKGIDYLFWNSTPRNTFMSELLDGRIKDNSVNSTYKRVIQHLENEISEYDEIVKEYDEDSDVHVMAAGLIADRRFLIDNFFKSETGPSVVELHKEFLMKLNLQVKGIELLDQDENDLTRDKDTQYDELSIEVNGKMTASTQIKLLLSQIPKADRDGTNIFNHLEFREFEDFGKIFAILSNRLTGSETLEEMIERIQDLTQLIPAMDFVVKHFNLSTNYNKISGTEKDKQMQFFRVFAKHKEEFTRIVTQPTGNHVTIHSDLTSNKSKIENRWRNNFSPSLTGAAITATKRGGALSFDEAVEQMAYMGFDVPNIELLPVEKQDSFARTVTTVTKNIFNQEDPFKIHRGGLMASLLDVANSLSLDSFDNSVTGMNNKSKYSNVDYSYFTLTLNKLRKIADIISEQGLTEQEGMALILQELPHFNNSYSKSSEVLRKIAAKGLPVNMEILEGVKKSSERGSEYSTLSEYDNIIAQVNNVLTGKFHLLRPSDNKLERVLNFGLFISPTEINTQKIAKQVNKLLPHLASELEVIKQANNIDTSTAFSRFNKLGENLRILEGEDAHENLKNSGILLAALASPNNLEIIKQYVRSEISMTEVLDHPSILQSLTVWYENLIADKILPMLEDIGFSDEIWGNQLLHSGLDVNLQTGDIQVLAHTFLLNYIIGNIEQTKLFTGHPSMYGDVETFFKRLSGMVGTKSLPSTEESTNDYLRKFGVNKENPYMKVAVIRDTKVISKYSQQIADALTKRYDSSKASAKSKRFYQKLDESDAASYMRLDAYREFLIRTGGWSWKQEAMYQWETQGGWEGNTVTVPKNISYQNEAGERITEDFPYEEIAGKTLAQSMVERDGFYLSPLKPQHMGPLQEEAFFINAYFKLATFPLLPSMMSSFPQLKEVSDKLENQKIDLLVVSSGNKVGTKLGDYSEVLNKQDGENLPAVQTIYDQEGKIKQDPLISVDTHYQYWGIQVQNAPKQKYKSSVGTQFVKQVEANLLKNGVPIDVKGSDRVSKWANMTDAQKLSESKVYKAIQDLRKLNVARQSLGVRKLKDKLGVKLYNNQYYVINDAKIGDVQSMLQNELSKRDMPSNTIDAIRYIEHGVDVLVNREQIENILMGIADDMTISRKRLGKSSVQMPATFLTTEREFVYEDGEHYFSSSDLAFYTKETKDGQEVVSEMEVYLPHYFKELSGGAVNLADIDPKLLHIVGFRIPTQGLNSIESIKIKGFLPQSAGDVVVVPSEIVAKTGSDFDFDKLFLHFPNYQIKEGKPQYIPYSYSKDIIWDRVQHEFSMGIPEFAKDISKIYKEYRAGLMNNIIGQDVPDAIMHNEILSKLNELGFKNKRIVRALQDLQDHYRIRHQILEEDILNEEETIEYLDVLSKMEDVIQDPDKIERALEASSFNTREIVKKKDRALQEVYSKAYHIFETLSREEQNGIAAIENEMMRIHKELITHPERFDELVNPVASDSFSDLAKQVLEWKGESVESLGMDSIADPDYVTRLGTYFQQGKVNISVSALNNTSHVLFSQVDAYLNKKKHHRIFFAHNTTKEGKPSLAGTYSKKDQRTYITDILSEMIGGYVDATKDPFMMKINGGTQGVQIYSLMIRLGISLPEVVLFMNQPIITEYLRGKSNRGSIYLSTIGKSFYSFENKIRDDYKVEKFSKKTVSNMRSPRKLREYIETYYQKGGINAFTEEDKSTQLQILNQFKYFEEMADSVSDAVRSLRFDTRSTGKNTLELIQMLRLKEKVKEDGVIGNYERLFSDGKKDNVPNIGFLHAYEQSLLGVKEAFTPYMTYLKYNNMENMFNTIIDLTLSTYDNDTVMRSFAADFITFLVQQTVVKNNEHGRLTYSRTKKGGVNKRNTKSVPRQIAQQKGRSNPNMLIEDLNVYLDNVDPDNSDKGATMIDSLSLQEGGRLDSFTSDQYTSAWEEMMENDKDLSDELLKFLWLQSGLQNSPLNFMKIAPNELYFDLISDAIEQAGGLNVDAFLHEFFFNNKRTPFWKKVGSTKQMKSNYPAYYIERQNYIAGGTNRTYYWFDGSTEKPQQLDKQKMRSIHNMRGNNMGTKKYYPGFRLDYYLKKVKDSQTSSNKEEKSNFEQFKNTRPKKDC